MRRILIEINDIKLTATILNSKAADAIYNALPFKGKVQRWGEAILFDTPVKMDVESKATKNIEIGDIAYSAMDSSFCIFFGKTPFSTSKKPKAHNLVNVFGKVDGNLELLKRISSQSQIQIKRIYNQKTDKSTNNSKGRVIPLWQETA